MDGRASISTDVLARYAADAACDVPGVRGLVEGHLPRQRAVRVTDEDGEVAVELHVAVDWDASIPDVGRGVQLSVRDYLVRMADLEPTRVDVVVAEIGPA